MGEGEQDGGGQSGGGYAPPGPPPLVFEQFGGVNTVTTRAGVPDAQAYWLDGFMPLAPRQLRTLWDIAPAIYTASGKTIVYYGFYNIGAVAYVVLFLSDGSVVQVQTSNRAVTTILAPGSISSPAITSIGISQWGQQYLIIVANQPNGYWVWDGTLVYTAGTLAPQITLTNVGNGYQTAPLVTFSGGNGSGATAVASIANGVVTNVTITNPGSGWLAGDAVTVTLSGGTKAGSGATFTARMTATGGGSGANLSASAWGVVGTNPPQYSPTSVTVNAGGSGYSQFATASWGGAAGSWLVGPPAIELQFSGGRITGAILAGGGGQFPNGVWQTSSSSFPPIVISDPGIAKVTSVTVNAGGSNYSSSVKLSVTGGSSPTAQATVTPTLTTGVITAVQVNNGGVYAGASPVPTVEATDTALTATATANLMPFGINGTAVNTFQGHVWVTNGPNRYWSAPGSIWNFATSAGGGADVSNDSFLKVGYTALVSTNGFLFLVGDSSMNYISGVQTSGVPPTTVFTNNNSDPEVGTPYPAAITTLGQDIVIANSVGVFVSSGGAFVKKSEMLDGVYNTVANFGGAQLSAAKATIFGKRVWMVLVPIIDPVTNVQVNKLLMWNGKVWWASTQSLPLTFIAGQEINSTYTAWGTDGTNLFQLFAQASTNFTKTIQTKLWDTPGGYEFNKAAARFWSLWQCFNTAGTNFTVKIDAVGIDGNGNQFTNSQPYAITGPSSTGFFVTPPQSLGQQGVLTGMTFTTTAADMALISAKLWDDISMYRG